METINYIEYALADLISAIARLEKAIEEQNIEDDITNAVIKTLYNNEVLIENYIIECKGD